MSLLRQILAELQAMRADTARDRRPSSLSRDDRARLARLLPVIAATFGSELLSSAELCEHEAPALRLVLAGVNAKQLGRLLRRATDMPIDGYMVLNEGTEAGSTLWRVVQVPDFPRDRKVSVPHAADRADR